MTNGGYIIFDAKDLVLDGVENTEVGITSKIQKIYNSKKPVIVTNLTIKKELTSLSNDIEVQAAHANLVIANGVYVLITMIASMNINININLDDTYQGIKF